MKKYQPWNEVHPPHCTESAPPRPASEEREHADDENVRYHDQVSYSAHIVSKIRVRTRMSECMRRSTASEFRGEGRDSRSPSRKSFELGL